MCFKKLFKSSNKKIEHVQRSSRFSNSMINHTESIKEFILIDDKEFKVFKVEHKTDLIKKIVKIEVNFFNNDLNEINKIFKCGNHTIIYENRTYTDMTIMNITGNKFTFDGYDLNEF